MRGKQVNIKDNEHWGSRNNRTRLTTGVMFGEKLSFLWGTEPDHKTPNYALESTLKLFFSCRCHADSLVAPVN